ncbi:13050_t:CDS:2, partial [Entrophospora sp. SA101]
MSEIEESWKTTLYNHPVNQTIRQFLSKFPLKLTRPIHRKRELNFPTLYIWGPGWFSSNEASFDCDCLKWQAILKFTKIKFDVEYANEPLMSPSKKLPFLVLETGEVLVDDNLELFIEQNSNELGKLNEEQKAQSAAYITTADTKLRNALPTNQETTFYKYSSHYPWPLNKILFHQASNNVIGEILTRNEALDRDQIYEEAADTLSALSTELNNFQYFFES